MNFLSHFHANRCDFKLVFTNLYLFYKQKVVMVKTNQTFIILFFSKSNFQSMHMGYHSTLVWNWIFFPNDTRRKKNPHVKRQKIRVISSSVPPWTVFTKIQKTYLPSFKINQSYTWRPCFSNCHPLTRVKTFNTSIPPPPHLLAFA